MFKSSRLPSPHPLSMLLSWVVGFLSECADKQDLSTNIQSTYICCQKDLQYAELHTMPQKTKRSLFCSDALIRFGIFFMGIQSAAAGHIFYFFIFFLFFSRMSYHTRANHEFLYFSMYHAKMACGNFILTYQHYWRRPCEFFANICTRQIKQCCFYNKVCLKLTCQQSLSLKNFLSFCSFKLNIRSLHSTLACTWT